MRNTSSFSFSRLLRFAPIFLCPLLLISCTVNISPRSRSAGWKGLPPAPAITPLNDWLYRGSQPKDTDFVRLRQMGVRTVVNFRTERSWNDWERELVEATGMRYVSLPWSVVRSVKPELMDQFFEILDDPANRPIYFHCKHGRDRSGVMATLALMRYENLSEREARELALETIAPQLHYRWFVNRKINFFLEARPNAFSAKASDG